MRRFQKFVLPLLLLPALLGAQRGSSLSPAPGEAHQFDFLIGQWDVVVTPTVSSLVARLHGVPRQSGTWKAWRALEGRGVEDELRITDAAGNAKSLSHSVRVFDQAAGRWLVSTFDVNRAAFKESSGEWNGTTLTLIAEGLNAEGKAVISRTRFARITPNAFRVVQDRSADKGKSWEEVQTSDAKRVAAIAPR
jgi:hypothetical protein